jgi:DNA-binding XRE family transcriptional regulator
VNAKIQARRQERGWSQQELAERAGVSRQLVGAVESGRHAPNVAAALAIARVLGLTVEELFGGPAPAAIDGVWDAPPAAGAAATTARVGDRLVAVVPACAVDTERWFVADAVVGDDGIEWLPGGRSDGLVLAGCDPVMGLVSELVGRSSPHRLLVAHATTTRAVEALSRGTVHGVVVHAGAGELPSAPVGVRRWRLASWQVGLARAGDQQPPTVEDLVVAGLSVAQREPGASSQHALVRALRAAGCEQLPTGPIADGHLDAARRVEVGQAEVALTMEAAAVAHRLSFAAIEEHDVELWIDERWADLPGVTALLDTLTSAAFLRRVERIGGYELARCGTEVG